MDHSSFHTRRHLAPNDPDALERLAPEDERDSHRAPVPVPPPGWDFTDYGMSVDGLEAVNGCRVGTTEVEDHVFVQLLDGTVVMDEPPPSGFNVSTWFRMRMRELGIEIGDVEGRALGLALDRALDRSQPLPGQPRPDDDQIGGFYRHAIEEGRVRGSSGDFLIRLVDDNPFRFALFYAGAQLLEEDFPLEEDGGYKQLLGLVASRVAEFDDIPNAPEQMLREWYERVEPLVAELFWEQVDAMTEQAEEAKRALPGRTAGELLASSPEEPNWLVPGLLAPGWTIKLAGREKLGKGTLAFYLLGRLERGEPTVFGAEPERPVTALVLSEEPEESVREKLDAFGIRRARIVFGYELAGLPWEEKIEALVQTAVAEGHGIVFVDNISRATGVEDESGPELARAVEKLADRIRAAGLAGIVDHHHKKGEARLEDKSRGNTALAGAMDVNVELERVGGWTSRRRKVSARGRLRSTIWQRGIELSEDGRDYFVADTTDERVEEQDAQLLHDRFVLAGMPDGATARTFAVAIGLDPEKLADRRKAKRRLDMLAEEGHATTSAERRPGRATTYEAVPAEPAEEG